MSDAVGAPHPDDSLSAYLDGGLEPGERAAVADHLRTCPSCQARLEELRSVRDVVRSLPLVDPPFGFVDDMLRLGPRPRSAAGGRRLRLVSLAVVTVLALVLIVGVARRELTGVHLDAADAAARFDAAPRPGGRGVVGASGTRLPGWAPDRLGPLAAAQVVDGDDGRVVVYGAAPDTVLLSAREGELDSDSLDGGTWTPVPAAGEEAWAAKDGDVVVLVVERGDHVYTLVGEQDATALARLAASLPDSEATPSMGDRVTAVGRGLLDAFGLGS